MFDMDGTLTDSFSIDENCYVLAIEQALDLPGVRTDWHSYQHTSASYCLEQIVHQMAALSVRPQNESRCLLA